MIHKKIDGPARSAAWFAAVNGQNFYQCGSNWYTRAYEGDAVVYVPSGPSPSK